MKHDKAERTTVVIAGSYAQFRNWCRENGKSPQRVVFCEPLMRDVARTRGLDRDYTDVVLVGTYHESREWPDVADELKASGLLPAA